jgi:hypothetical protein
LLQWRIGRQQSVSPLVPAGQGEVGALFAVISGLPGHRNQIGPLRSVKNI